MGKSREQNMIFRKIGDSAAINRKSEENIYEIVIEEIKSGIRKEGLWAQALVKAEGSEKKAEAAYIALRAQALKDDVRLFESIRRKIEKQIARDEAKTSVKPGGSSRPVDPAWQCARCGGRVGVNYGSSTEIICERCA